MNRMIAAVVNDIAPQRWAQENQLAILCCYILGQELLRGLILTIGRSKYVLFSKSDKTQLFKRKNV